MINVTIYVSGGTGIGEWLLPNGTYATENIGEISDHWLDNCANKHFSELLEQDVTIEVIDVEDSQDPTDWMSEAFTDGY